MKKALTLVVGGLVLGTSSMAVAANSISGSTDFRVNIPEVLVLYHWDDAYLTLTDIATTPANDSDGREISDPAAHNATGILAANGTYTISGDVKTDTVATSPLATTVDVTLKNAWAVRSISNDNVTLALTNPNTTLKSVNGGATAVTSAAVLQSTATGTTGTNSATMTLPPSWVPTMGDIKFKLDLTNATKPGEYNTRGAAGAATAADEATDTFLLTLTGN